VASSLPAFLRVLDSGQAGAMFANEEPDALAGQLLRLIESPAERERLSAEGRRRARVFDWSVVAEDVMAVYEMVTHGADLAPLASATDTRWTRLLRGRGRGGEE
jgi:phosphatidylinositol alpha-mannosyltransferase